MEQGTAEKDQKVRVMQGYDRVNEVGVIEEVIPAEGAKLETAKVRFDQASSGGGIFSGGPAGVVEIPTLNIALEVGRENIPKPHIRAPRGDEMVQETSAAKERVSRAAREAELNRAEFGTDGSPEDVAAAREALAEETETVKAGDDAPESGGD